MLAILAILVSYASESDRLESRANKSFKNVEMASIGLALISLSEPSRAGDAKSFG